MNSETQLLVKMTYTGSVCSVLMKYADTIEAFSTLDWLKSKSIEVVHQILREGGKKAFSWARVADRCNKHIETLKQDDWADTPIETVDMAEEIIYTLAVLTRMLEDISNVGLAKDHDINRMITAAYTIENVLGLEGKNKHEREDEIRGMAFDFLDQLYKKMGEI